MIRGRKFDERLSENRKRCDGDSLGFTFDQIGKRSANRGSGADDVVHNRNTAAAKLAPQRIWNAISHRI